MPNNGLAFSLLRENNNEKSFVFSPFSLGSALSMVHLGAGGTTRQELEEVLYDEQMQAIRDDPKYRDVVTKDDLNSINNYGNEMEMNVENCWLLGKGIHLIADYQKRVEEDYGASVEECDFDDKEKVAQHINDYCSRKTEGYSPSADTKFKFVQRILKFLRLNNCCSTKAEGRIRSLVKPSDLSVDTGATIINVVYMAAAWLHDFFPRKTAEDNFRGVDRTRKVMFMNGERSVPLNFSDPHVKVIGLRYRRDGLMMWFFLPAKGEKLRDWIAKLDTSHFSQLIERAQDERCILKLPRFTVETSLPADEQLRAIGCAKMFSDEADISGISPDLPQIGRIIHKASLNVNEWGTIAAAATDLALRGCGDIPKPVEFIADRPFFYAITFEGNILFCGTFY